MTNLETLEIIDDDSSKMFEFSLVLGGGLLQATVE
jgi:hypothetical protein